MDVLLHPSTQSPPTALGQREARAIYQPLLEGSKEVEI